MPDSLAVTPMSADTAAVLSGDAAPAPAAAADTLLWHKVCRADEAPSLVGVKQSFTMGRIAWSQGMPAEPRAMLPGYDSGVMVMLIAALVILATNFRHCSTYLKNLPANLWSIKKRDNAFDETHTLSETRIVLSMALIVCIMEGIIVYSLLPGIVPPGWGVGAGVGIATAAAGLFYALQLAAYSFTGYLFGTPRDRSLWVKGFNASQALLVILLTVPAHWLLFNPGAAVSVAIIAAICYFLAKMVFICKGFRIFYENSFSLLYFILYLCTLEIAPIFALVKIAGRFV